MVTPNNSRNTHFKRHENINEATITETEAWRDSIPEIVQLSEASGVAFMEKV